MTREPEFPYVVLADAAGLRSLWPAADQPPPGWTIVHGPASSATCLDHIHQHWTHPTPGTLAA